MDRIIKRLDSGWQIVSREQKLWLPHGELPYGDAARFDLVDQRAPPIGEQEGETIWLIQQQRQHDMGLMCQVIDQDVGLFQLTGRGVQLTEFCRSYKFYGCCGHPMCPGKTEWATFCSHYRERCYPQIAPCIIAVIRRGDSILLAQHAHYHNDVHVVLTGFVEVGETLEQAVAREVMEENGIEAKNLRCVTSQSWPFPQFLMTAFMAEYDSGEIAINPKELLEVNWYRYDDLPLLPPPGIVTHRLVEDTVAICRVEYE